MKKNNLAVVIHTTLINPFDLSRQLDPNEAQIITKEVIKFIGDGLFLYNKKFSDIINDAAIMKGWDLTLDTLEGHCQIFINNAILKNSGVNNIVSIINNANDMTFTTFEPIRKSIDVLKFFNIDVFYSTSELFYFSPSFFFIFISYSFLILYLIFKLN